MDQIIALREILEGLHLRLSDPLAESGEVLDWMVQNLNYLEYFKDYYGPGEQSEEKKLAVLNFIHYASQLHIHPLAFLEHLKRLDTTQGADEKELIIFTTIFRTKGLEYDYVFIPECDENLMPYLKGDHCDIYDLQGLVKESNLSNALECERRLFYVALTRARKGIYIGYIVETIPFHRRDPA